MKGAKSEGRYSAAFDLTLSSSTPAAEIRYTTDGSEPTLQNGTVAQAAATVPIAGTTVVRARSYAPGRSSSPSEPSQHPMAARAAGSGSRWMSVMRVLKPTSSLW